MSSQHKSCACLNAITDVVAITFAIFFSTELVPYENKSLLLFLRMLVAFLTFVRILDEQCFRS